MTPDARRLRLSMELERDSDPIAGYVSDASGRGWTFIGWVDLTNALEEALAANRSRDDRSGDEPS